MNLEPIKIPEFFWVADFNTDKVVPKKAIVDSIKLKFDEKRQEHIHVINFKNHNTIEYCHSDIDRPDGISTDFEKTKLWIDKYYKKVIEKSNRYTVTLRGYRSDVDKLTEEDYK